MSSYLQFDFLAIIFNRFAGVLLRARPSKDSEVLNFHLAVSKMIYLSEHGL